MNKTSRRDLALVMAKGLDGATTVSATMLLAARAGINVFVTGGAASHHARSCRPSIATQHNIPLRTDLSHCRNMTQTKQDTLSRTLED